MIEEIIRDYLLNVLDVPVYVDVPADPEDSCVVIERTGGSETEHIRSATIAVQSYGPRKTAAAELHEQVLRLLPDIADGIKVSACNLNAEYDYTDTQTKRYRYQAVFDLVYY